MIIFKKILRDLKTNKGANIAATALIGVAFMIFTLYGSLNQTLQLSVDEFYEASRFPDAFAEVIRFEREELNSLKNIEGIEAVGGRVVLDFVLDDNQNTTMEKTIESKYLRIFAGDSNLSTYIVEDGMEPQNNLEIVIDPVFAKANKLEIGDAVYIQSNGKTFELKIVGVGRSAENTFATKNISDFFPDATMFGVAYTNLNVMNNLVGEVGFNNLVFEYQEGYSFEEVKNKLLSKLNPYGLLALYDGKDQQSNALMIQELDGIKSMTNSLPAMFLLVSMTIVYIMLKRMVELQRGQIGIMKAFGYTNFQISLQYVIYTSTMGLVGSFVGGIIGLLTASPFMKIYEEFFNMPFQSTASSWFLLPVSIIGALIFSILTGILGGRGALSLEPAEAMRPREPKSFTKKLKIEKFKPLISILTISGRLGLRNLGRNRGRGIFIILGVSFTTAICAVPWSMTYQMMPLLYDRYEYVEKYDLKINLNAFIDGEKGILEMYQNDVKLAEPLLEVPFTLSHDNLSKETILVGLLNEGKLYTLVDENNEKISINKGELVITSNLAEKLNLKVGEVVIVKSPYSKFKDQEKEVVISAIVNQLTGSNGYMDIKSLSNLLDSDFIANRILISGEESVGTELKNIYKDSPIVSGVSIADSLLNKLEEMMNLMVVMLFYLGIIAIITGFAIIYNSTITVISEREREITSMMVIGLSEREVFNILSFEQWALSIVGMIVAFPLARIMLEAILSMMAEDLFYIPSTVHIPTYILSLGVTIIAIIIGQIAAFKKIKKLNLVDALKSIE